MTDLMYDSKCYDLADAFFEDEPELRTEENVRTLAALLQQTIEDFIEDMRRARGRDGDD